MSTPTFRSTRTIQYPWKFGRSEGCIAPPIDLFFLADQVWIKWTPPFGGFLYRTVGVTHMEVQCHSNPDRRETGTSSGAPPGNRAKPSDSFYLAEDGSAIKEHASAEEIAFSCFYRNHYSVVRFWLWRHGIRSADLEDVAQETFMVAYRKWNEIPEEKLRRVWIYRVAHHCARNWQRRSSRYHRKHLALAEARSSHEENHGDVERLVRQGLAYQCLRDIEPKKLDVFIQAEVFGMSCREIAETGRMNLNTARSRLNSARKEVARIANQLLASEVESNASYIVGFLKDAFQVPQGRVEKGLQGCLLAIGPWMMAKTSRETHEIDAKHRQEDFDGRREPDSLARFPLGSRLGADTKRFPRFLWGERSPRFKQWATVAVASGLLLAGLSGSSALDFFEATQMVTRNPGEMVDDSMSWVASAPKKPSIASELSAAGAGVCEEKPIGIGENTLKSDSSTLNEANKSLSGKKDHGKRKTTSNLAEENRLLKEALLAERRGDWPKAERWLRQHQHQFRRGQLAHIRWATLIRVYCKWGRHDQALRAKARASKANMASSQIDPAFRHCKPSE